MKKFLALRFDIDTPKCLRAGVPPLLELSARTEAKFTFFLNTGRAVSVLGFFMRKLRPRPSIAIAKSLSARQKLGTVEYLYTAIRNPNIIDLAPDVVRQLAQTQDLGLHGGRNHDNWHHGARDWTPEKVRDELRWALRRLQRMEIAVKGFSSPGWTDRQDLSNLLGDLGFLYRADIHGSGSHWTMEGRGFINLATNLVGEPGGVAYIEHLRALGLDDSAIVNKFREDLEAAGDYAVMYDHPYYAGVHAIPLLERLIQEARQQQFQIVTLNQIAQRVAGST